MLGQLATLLKVTANFNNLGDIVVRCEFHGSNVHLYHVFQEVLRVVRLVGSYRQ
jgi:hypothetical protein